MDSLYRMKHRSVDAVIEYPIFLLAALTIAATLIVTGFLAINQLEDEFKKHQINEVVSKILLRAEELYVYADEDSTICILSVELPDNLLMMVFGGIPFSSRNYSPVFDVNTSSSYYYVLDNGEIHQGYSTIRFSVVNPVILHSGHHELVLKLINYGGRKYVEIREE